MKLETGNALFLILIAVALFAALSYAITSSSRGSGNVDKEQAQIAASQIVQYATLIQNSLNRLRIMNGCSDTTISFWHDMNNDGIENNTDFHFNSLSPSDHSCHVFDTAGGGVTAIQPNPEWIDPTKSGQYGYGMWIVTGSTSVRGVGTDCADATCNDLIFIYPYLKEDICIALNRGLDFPLVSGAVMADDVGMGMNSFARGSFYYDYTADEEIYNATQSEPIAQMSGCINANANPGIPGNHFYHVLWAR